MKELKDFFRKYPILGMRTLKTVIAVIITCLIFKYLLNQNPFFACIGAVVAMEKTISTSIKAAIIRNIGTITGGLIGILIGSITENTVVMALGLVPVIWINNVIGKKESIVPGSIVYFAVFFLNTMDQAWIYGITRILGTLAGTVIALVVNAVILPVKIKNQQNDFT